MRPTHMTPKIQGNRIVLTFENSKEQASVDVSPFMLARWLPEIQTAMQTLLDRQRQQLHMEPLRAV